MDWFIVFLIFIVLLGITLILLFRKKTKMGKSKVTFKPIVPQTKIEATLPPQNEIDEPIENIPIIETPPQRRHKPISTYRPPITQQKSYVRYDWQKKFEGSIISPFPEDSPALPFLVEANRLEREGASKLLIDEALSEARKLDTKAVEFYLARWSIIKKRHKLKD